MEELDALEDQNSNRLTKFAIAAIIFAIIGLGDSIYLTVHHYTNEQVPCSIITGCEQVLTSEYAEFYGIPTAAFGVLAYFLAFALALLVAFGNRKMWLFRLADNRDVRVYIVVDLSSRRGHRSVLSILSAVGDHDDRFVFYRDRVEILEIQIK